MTAVALNNIRFTEKIFFHGKDGYNGTRTVREALNKYTFGIRTLHANAELEDLFQTFNVPTQGSLVGG